MARNKYDIDETLETPFNIAHLKRSFIYMKKHKKANCNSIDFICFIISFFNVYSFIIKGGD